MGVPKSALVPTPFVRAQIITAMSNLLNEADSHWPGWQSYTPVRTVWEPARP
jgi:hypothetical protein